MARQSNWTSRARALARRGWSVDRIAEECGYWPSRVRRALRAERVDDPVMVRELEDAA
jgi:hypothetical protein